jgi:hypothetical protein
MYPLLAAVLHLASSPLPAGTDVVGPAGVWEGVLLIPGEPTAFAVTLEHADDGWSANLDIPAPRIRERSFDRVEVHADSVGLELGSMIRLRGARDPGERSVEAEAVIQEGSAGFALARAGSREAVAPAEQLARFPRPEPAPDAAFDRSAADTRSEAFQSECRDRATPG